VSTPMIVMVMGVAANTVALIIAIAKAGHWTGMVDRALKDIDEGLRCLPCKNGERCVARRVSR